MGTIIDVKGLGRLDLSIACAGWTNVALAEPLYLQLMAKTTRRCYRPRISHVTDDLLCGTLTELGFLIHIDSLFYSRRSCKQTTSVHRLPPEERLFPNLGEKVWWPRVTLSFLLNKYAMVLPSVVSNTLSVSSIQ